VRLAFRKTRDGVHLSFPQAFRPYGLPIAPAGNEYLGPAAAPAAAAGGTMDVDGDGDGGAAGAGVAPTAAH